MSQLETMPRVAQEDRVVEFKPFMSDTAIKLSVRMVQNFICTPTRDGTICDDRDAMRFIMLCKARLLNPFEGDAYLVGYKKNDGTVEFTLITAHQAFLKRAEVHPGYDGMESGVIVRDKNDNVIDRKGDFIFDDDQLLGAWATIHFKNRKIPTERRIRLKNFKKDFGVWKNNPEGMIVKCAEADALRSAFPTSLGGMYLEGEMEINLRQVSDVPTPQAALPARGVAALADKLKSKNGKPDHIGDTTTMINANAANAGASEPPIDPKPAETPEGTPSSPPGVDDGNVPFDQQSEPSPEEKESILLDECKQAGHQSVLNWLTGGNEDLKKKAGALLVQKGKIGKSHEVANADLLRWKKEFATK